MPLGRKFNLEHISKRLLISVIFFKRSYMTKIIRSVSVLLSLAFVLSGCTTYTELGIFGGVSSLRVNENTWEFNSSGNAFANETQISDYILLRAAEVALENNFTHFIPAARRTETRETVTSVAGETSASTSCGTRGCSAAAAATGPRYEVYYKPYGQMIATFFSNDPNDPVPPEAISAALIYQQLAPKYISKDKLRSIQ